MIEGHRYIVQPGRILFGLLCVMGCAGNRQMPPAAPPQAVPEITLHEAPPKFEVTDRVQIETTMGVLILGLYGKDAPRTVENFLEYVDSGFFENKIFHRIISGFMVQGGGYDTEMTRSETNAPIDLELIPGLEHGPGVVSMARTPDDINSATSQFFICVSQAKQLNGSYAAFGRLEAGEDVLFAISGVPTHSVETEYGTMNDVPIQPVVIKSMNRL